jgi:hypothetical protein
LAQAARELGPRGRASLGFVLANHRATCVGRWPTTHWGFLPVMRRGRRGDEPVIGDAHRLSRCLDPAGETAFPPFLSWPAPAGFTPPSQSSRPHEPTQAPFNRSETHATGRRAQPPALTVLHPNTAGIHVRADMQLVRVPADRMPPTESTSAVCGTPGSASRPASASGPPMKARSRRCRASTRTSARP